jgi:hypothetical protein
MLVRRQNGSFIEGAGGVHDPSCLGASHLPTVHAAQPGVKATCSEMS